jgi:hypothetical protein
MSLFDFRCIDIYLFRIYFVCARDCNETVVSVCRSVVEEIDNVIQKVDPKRTMEVGSYRLDSMGNQKQKTVSSCIQLSVDY